MEVPMLDMSHTLRLHVRILLGENLWQNTKQQYIRKRNPLILGG